jgi:hypothetical protein
MLIPAELSIRTTTSTNKVLTTLCIYGFLLYATIVLLYPVIVTRDASFCIKQDNLHQTYPYFNKLASSLHKGYLPVWDANTYGGKNFAGEIQTGIFYPINIIWCLIFGSVNGIDVYYVDLLTALHFLICLLGMYKLSRMLQFPPVAAIASGLVFTFTSAVAARAGGQTGIFFGLTLLPWSVYFTARYYLVRKNRTFFAVAGLVAGLEILAGHMQPFFHTMIINGVMIAFYEYRNRKNWKTFFLSTFTNLLILLFLVFIITLPQMYYSLQYLSNVYRSVGPGVLVGPGRNVPIDIYTHRFMINLYNLPNLLGQELTPPEDDNIIYMGILPLFLFIIYMVRHKLLKLLPVHAEITKLLLIILIIGTICALGYITFIPLILHQLPFVPVVRQLGRYIILISFSAALLTGMAITYIGEIKKHLFQRHAKITQYVLIALCLNTIYLIIAQQQVIPWSISIPFLACFLFFLALMNMKRSVDITILAVAVIFVDLYFNRVSYSSTKTDFFATTYYGRNRIIDTLEATTYGKYRVAFDMSDYALERRNLGNMYNIQIPYGYSATYNKAYLDFLNVDGNLNSETNNLLNIRYIITDKILDSAFILKDSVQQIKLYEKRNYYPRIYWQRQLSLHGAEIEAENKSTIQQLAYSDLYQKIAVDCQIPDTLIIAENVYPGWKCYDNQKEIPIRPAKIKNYPPLFRSVVLDKGHHLLEFKYNKVFHWF